MMLGAKYTGDGMTSVYELPVNQGEIVVTPAEVVRELLLERSDFDAVYVDEDGDCQEVELWA